MRYPAFWPQVSLTKRILVAFLLSPLACVIPALYPALDYPVTDPVWFRVSQFWSTVTGSMYIGWFCEFVFGVPALFLLNRFHKNSFAAYSATGFVLGVLFVVIFNLSTGVLFASLVDTSEHWIMYKIYGLCGAAGFLSAGLFWVIARPDWKVFHDEQ